MIEDESCKQGPKDVLGTSFLARKGSISMVFTREESRSLVQPPSHDPATLKLEVTPLSSTYLYLSS